MAALVLQHIILPDKNDVRLPLFLRETNWHGIHGNQYTLSFETYFNSFVWRKWKKYTCLSNLWLNVEASGKFVLEVISIDGDNRETVIARIYPNQKKILKINIDAPENCVLLYHQFIYDDSSQFIYGDSFYSTETESVSLVKILGIITTFRRETYLKRNVKIIQEAREKEPVLKEHFKLLIVDNDSSLDKEKYEGSGVRLVHNINAGGSGGFARGMIEALDTSDIHYIVLMDDDIELEPETLYRTITFLSFLKSKYRSYMLGAAMFSLGDKCRQHAWLEYVVVSNYTNRHFYSNIEMKERKNLVISSIFDDYPLGYNAWWYCAIPMNVVRKNGLPFPFFLKYDDIEYGLRNDSQIILLNGICVWHEDFAKKEDLITNFFGERSHLYFMLLYKPKFITYVRSLIGMSLGALRGAMRYNYGYLEVYSKVFKSLCKGTKELQTNMVTPEFLAQLKTFNPVRNTDKEEYLFYLGYIHSRIKAKDRGRIFLTLLSWLTVGGHVLPSFCYSRKFICAESEPLSRSLFSREIVQVYESGKFYEKRQISSARFWRGLCIYGYHCVMALFAYPRLKRDFQTNSKQMKETRFWRTYLGIEESVKDEREDTKA